MEAHRKRDFEETGPIIVSLPSLVNKGLIINRNAWPLIIFRNNIFALLAM